jgi:hypothetical protein
MSDSENGNSSPHVTKVVEPTESTTKEKKSGRAVMTDQKLANLEKARAARKANLEAKKYSKDKRGKAEERIEEEVKRRAREEAEKLADEVIARRELEKELSEYRAWKKEQAKVKKDDADEQPSAKGAKGGKKAATGTKTNKKPPAKPRKKKVQDISSDDDEEPVPARGRARAAPKYEVEQEDWLAGVLD